MPSPNEFWTNFSQKERRTSFGTYEILDDDPKLPGYWKFKTTLPLDHLESLMTESERKRFLTIMWEYYYRRGTQ